MATVTVTTLPCPLCKKASTLDVDAMGYRKWAAGALVQNAFPAMPKEQRELLITGMHSECWDKVFKGRKKEIDGIY